MSTPAESEARAAAEARYPLRLPYNAEFERQAARADGFVEGYLSALASRVSTPPTPTLDVDEVAKVLCRIEGRSTGRSLDEVVAPGVELWMRHRYEAERLIEELSPLLAVPAVPVLPTELETLAPMSPVFEDALTDDEWVERRLAAPTEPEEKR